MNECNKRPIKIILLTSLKRRNMLKIGADYSIVEVKFYLMALRLKYIRGLTTHVQGLRLKVVGLGLLHLDNHPRLSPIFSRYPAFKRLFKGRLMLRSIVCASVSIVIAVRIACFKCNRSKRDKSLAEWRCANV